MKMAIKETVEIRFSTPKKTGSVTCNPYYDADGNHRAISTPIEGEYRTVRQTTASRVLDLSIPKHKEEYDFLKDHPFVIGREPLLKIINTTIESETKINDIDVTFDALKIVKDLQATKLSDFARVCGIPTTNTSETVIKAKLYEMAEKKPKRLIELWDDGDRALKALLHKGREQGVFKVDTNTKAWKYNKQVLGTSLEHAVQWLKDNKDLMPTIRKQVK
jgi:hypothetical protein